MVMGAAEVDFATETSNFESDETAVLPYDSANTAAIDLTASCYCEFDITCDSGIGN